MGSKLLKYELSSYLQNVIPIQIVALSIAVLFRIVQFTESRSMSYNILFRSTCVVFCITLAALLILTVFFIIRRFYKNFYSAEGYLTFTLPATPSQHILVKLFAAVIISVTTVITLLLSLVIASSGRLLVEILKAANYLFSKAGDFFGYEFYIAAVLTVSFVLVYIMSRYLLFYACMSVGQLASKKKALLSLGIYFGYYIAKQITGTVFIILISSGILDELIEKVLEAIDKLGFSSYNIIISIFTVLYLFIGFIYFLIAEKLTEKKLNLE